MPRPASYRARLDGSPPDMAARRLPTQAVTAPDQTLRRSPAIGCMFAPK